MTNQSKDKSNNKVNLPTANELKTQRDQLIEEFNSVQAAIEKAKEENQQRLGRISLLNELVSSN